MNDKSLSPSDDDLRFDRLADGEAGPDEYRSLLASLDDEPGGWRRCAMAFLEAQALEKDLGGLRREADKPQAAQSTRRPVGFQFGSLLALAASIVASLGLGFALGDGLPAKLWRDGNNRIVSHPEPRRNGAVGNPGQRQELVNDPRGRRQPLGNVTLVMDRDNGPGDGSVDLPVFDSSAASELLAPERSALPIDVREAIERIGHRVERRQQLVPVDLGEGRQLIVPVEQFRIVPAGSGPY